MKSLQIALGIAAIAVSIVTALPHLDAATLDALKSKLVAEGKCPYAAQQAATRNEKECPHLKEELKRRAVFDPVAQKVSTTGTHAWVAPKSGDQRGPCPGLNALANHGYLPHNGVADIPTIIQAVNTGMLISFSNSFQSLSMDLMLTVVVIKLTGWRSISDRSSQFMGRFSMVTHSLQTLGTL